MSGAVDQLRAAIADAGPAPAVHWATFRKHREEWPTLWAAIDAVLQEDIDNAIRR